MAEHGKGKAKQSGARAMHSHAKLSKGAAMRSYAKAKRGEAGRRQGLAVKGGAGTSVERQRHGEALQCMATE